MMSCDELKDLVGEQILERADDDTGDVHERVRKATDRPALTHLERRQSERRVRQVEVPDALVTGTPFASLAVVVALVDGVRQLSQKPLDQRPLHVEHDQRGVRRQRAVHQQAVEHRGVVGEHAAGHEILFAGDLEVIHPAVVIDLLDLDDARVDGVAVDTLRKACGERFALSSCPRAIDRCRASCSRSGSQRHRERPWR